MIFMMGVSLQANEMMLPVALLVCSLAVHVHGQSTSGVDFSVSSPEPTPTFTSATTSEAASSTSVEASSSSALASTTSSSPSAVVPTSVTSSSPSAVVSTSVTSSPSAVVSTSVTSSRADVSSSATSATISSVGVASTNGTMTTSDAQSSVVATTAAIMSSAFVAMPSPSATLTTSTSTQDSVTTVGTTSSPVPSVPLQSPGLSTTEFQLVVAVPVSVFGYAGMLLLLLLVVFACRRWRRRKDKGQVDDYTAIYSATVFDNKDADDEAETAFKPKPMRVTYRPKIPVMSHPLTVAELGALMQNEDAIANEFANIPSNMVTMDDIPPGAEAKNRYRNVLPNPHTRVPLFLKFGVANSDYINANYIRGFTGVPRAFISAQGPLWETTPDFWRMVWEQRSSIIVMLTELEENNMMKCHRYWPDEPEGRTAVYDDVEVTLAKRVMEKHFTTTTFLLRHLEKGVTREVIHLWFRAWPDHGAPEYAEPFLNFIQTFRSATADLPVGPVVVHCSAGIGRSGVFIATCMGLVSLEESGEVDILKLVSTMRQDRGGMVQSRTQYIFLHKALYQYGLWQERAKAPNSSFVPNDPPSGDGSQVKLLD